MCCDIKQHEIYKSRNTFIYWVKYFQRFALVGILYRIPTVCSSIECIQWLSETAAAAAVCAHEFSKRVTKNGVGLMWMNESSNEIDSEPISFLCRVPSRLRPFTGFQFKSNGKGYRMESIRLAWVEFVRTFYCLPSSQREHWALKMTLARNVWRHRRYAIVRWWRAHRIHQTHTILRYTYSTVICEWRDGDTESHAFNSILYKYSRLLAVVGGQHKRVERNALNPSAKHSRLVRVRHVYDVRFHRAKCVNCEWSEFRRTKKNIIFNELPISSDLKDA